MPSFKGLTISARDGGPADSQRRNGEGECALGIQTLNMTNTFGTITGPSAVTVSGDDLDRGIMSGTGVTNLNGTSTLSGGFSRRSTAGP